MTKFGKLKLVETGLTHDLRVFSILTETAAFRRNHDSLAMNLAQTRQKLACDVVIASRSDSDKIVEEGTRRPVEGMRYG